MFNALTKISLITIGLIAISCNSSNNDQAAAQLLTESKTAFQAGQYQRAISLLDSIDTAYPGAIDIRREVQSLRPVVLEQLTLQELNENDSHLTELAILGDSLKSMTEIKKNDIESYYVAKGTSKIDVATTNGLHVRLSPQYNLYAIATCPVGINARQISVRAGGVSVQSPFINYDGERNRNTSSHQTITFTEAEIDTIASFIHSHINEPLEIIFYGDKEWIDKLDPNQVREFDLLYSFSSAVKRDNQLRIERQRLEQQLHTVRTQMARTAK